MRRKNAPLPKPPLPVAKTFTDGAKTVDYLIQIYQEQTSYLQECFKLFVEKGTLPRQIRSFYPYVRFELGPGLRRSIGSYAGLSHPGLYETTITRPTLFKDYLIKQIDHILKNRGGTLQAGLGITPMPIHFAFDEGFHMEGDLSPEMQTRLRQLFDMPDLSYMDDNIANNRINLSEPQPLALFTGPRTDYSLHRLKHYTGTSCEYFQQFVLFTNYHFYLNQFVERAQELMLDKKENYTGLVIPGDRIIRPGEKLTHSRDKSFQMPAYHLMREDGCGVTMIDMGVGPANARTITDHVAVLRPQVWLMLGHCAGLRSTQRLGDYVLAHGFVREDRVLDEELPVWVPVPALAEIQKALERSVEIVAGCDEDGRKKIMRTGTVMTTTNRNWELEDQGPLVQRLGLSRAIALDMESGTIAANGFRLRVPYGSLLCVSDMPMEGTLKLPGMAQHFYKSQVDQHLEIGLCAMRILRAMEPFRLHSRKLRGFNEHAFR